VALEWLKPLKKRRRRKVSPVHRARVYDVTILSPPPGPFPRCQHCPVLHLPICSGQIDRHDCDLFNSASMYERSKYYSSLAGWPNDVDVTLVLGDEFAEAVLDETIEALPELYIDPALITHDTRRHRPPARKPRRRRIYDKSQRVAVSISTVVEGGG
jgi:hypothetical protein